MSDISVQEISMLLSSRTAVDSQAKNNREIPPVHRDWDEVSKASLVILWGMLVYPQLDPDMKKQRKDHSVHLDQVYSLFQQHLGPADKWKEILVQLKKYDYIRYRSSRQITAGTRLWTSVDAAKMYRMFRTSVLVRQLNVSAKS